jgi:hypothetical protein
LNVNPQDVSTVVSTIDDIMKDPALNKVVGPVEGQGGNNVDDLGTTRSMYYGKDGLALIQKIAQLQSTTWLSARQMLKGGGAITDYESRKAEAAMARLSRVQGEDEFKAALKDLRDAIEAGQKKLAGTPAPDAAASAGAPDFSKMDLGQLGSVDVNTLDDAGMQALSDRLKEFGH